LLSKDSNIRKKWEMNAFEAANRFQRGDAWTASFLFATAQVLGRRIIGMNEELVKLSAELRQNLTQPHIRKAVAEIEHLRKRLTTEWRF
jgi:hypothetical protein